MAERSKAPARLAWSPRRQVRSLARTRARAARGTWANPSIRVEIATGHPRVASFLFHGGEKQSPEGSVWSPGRQVRKRSPCKARRARGTWAHPSIRTGIATGPSGQTLQMKKSPSSGRLSCDLPTPSDRFPTMSTISPSASAPADRPPGR